MISPVHSPSGVYAASTAHPDLSKPAPHQKSEAPQDRVQLSSEAQAAAQDPEHNADRRRT